jgi:putative phosphoesterase
MVRFVVVSDIHSNLDALEAVVKRFPEYDELLCLGDLVGYGPQPNEVVERLRGLRPAVVLMGNHDYAVVTGDTEGFSSNAAKAVDWTRGRIREEHRQYLAALKPTAKLEMERTALGLYHGSPRDPLTEYIYPGMPEVSARALIRQGGANVLLLGHTHIPMLYAFDDAVLANPGSVGQPRDGDSRASFAVLTIIGHSFDFRVERVEYDVDSVAKKIRDSGLPSFLAERLYVGG